MKNKIISYLNRTHGFKTARRGIVLVLTLALIAYNFSSGVLPSLGAAGSDAPACGLEEHAHTRDCYTTVLACDHTEGPDGTAPIHDRMCYVSQLICAKEEHVHTDECYAESAENNAYGSDANKFQLNEVVDTNLISPSTSTSLSAFSDFSETNMFDEQADSALSVKTSYGLLNPKTATNMYNGNWEQDNSQNNRYVLFVGEELELAAQGDSEGQSWTIEKTEGSELKPSLSIDKGTETSYLATTPGKYQITLNNSAGSALSTFYFEVKYPIFVETAVGAVHKDKVHEYLEAAGHKYNASPQVFITTPDGREKNTALYVKNLAEDPGKYIMYPNNTVTLSAYYVASGNSSPAFETIAPNLEKGETKTDNVVINNVNFTKVTATFKATGEGDARVTFGTENTEEFGIYVRKANHTGDANHFDIEIADGSTYTDTVTTIYANGSSKTVTTDYTAEVTRVNLCTVNDSNGKEIGQLGPEAYFDHGDEGGTQFELTSAYDANGLFVGRDINYPEVAEVVFNVNIQLTPLSQTVTERDATGKERITVTDPDSLEPIDLRGQEYSLTDTYILDAQNKCPAHNGLDFTILSGNELIKLEPAVHKTLQDNDGSEMALKKGDFTFGLWRDSDDLNQAPHATAENDENGNVTFEAIDLNSNNEAAEYVYYIKEISDPQKTGIDFDATIYKMTVTLSKDADKGAIVANVAYACSKDGGVKFETYTGTIPEFTNTDTTQPTPEPASVEFKVHKTLVDIKDSKLSLGQKKFTFGLWTSDDLSQKPSKEVTNDQNGNASFGKITYDSDDFDESTTYVYYIKEITGTDKNIEYDATIYKMTVTLSKDADKEEIAANVVYEYSKDDGKSWLPYVNANNSALEFINKDTNEQTSEPPTSASVEFKVHKTLVDIKDSKLSLGQKKFTFGLWTSDDLSQKASKEITNDQNGNASFGKITYDSDDFDESTEYVYYIKEITGTDKNIKYDATIYRIKVTLSKDTDKGEIVANVVYEYLKDSKWLLYNANNGTLEFVNKDTTTEPTPTPPTSLEPGKWTPRVFKKVVKKEVDETGDTELKPKQGDFFFGLWTNLSDLQSGKEPDKGRAVLGQIGYAYFDSITYSREDYNKSTKYVYYIKELAGLLRYIEYDETIYRVTVTLSIDEDKGEIVANVAYDCSKDGGVSWKTYTDIRPVFTNIFRDPYAPTPTPPGSGGSQLPTPTPPGPGGSQLPTPTPPGSGGSGGSQSPSPKPTYPGGSQLSTPTPTPTSTPTLTKDQIISVKTVNITLEKVWDDKGSKNTRPESVVIQLLKNGTVYDEVTLSERNKWFYTWNALDSSAEWTVKEVNVPSGYTVTYKREGMHFTVTNTASLPQTGQLNWPIPVLLGCGLLLIILGSIWECAGRKKRSNEN